MGWDDQAPTAGELGTFWDSEPPKKEELENSFDKTVKNIIPDAVQMIKGLGETVKGPALDIASGDVATALPKLVKEGQAFFEHPKENLEAMARPVTHPVEYFKEHPVQQTLNALTLMQALSGPKGPVSVPGAEVPPEMIPMRGTPEPMVQPPSRMPPDPNAPPIPKSTPLDAPPTPSTPSNPLQEAKDYADSILPKAKEFVTKQYAKQAQDPGWANTMARYLKQESQNMAVKQMGASPAQAKQIGEEGTQALGQYALDKHIVDPKVGSIGMKERTNAINKKAGETIGALRDQADSLRDPMQPIDVLQTIRKELDSKYARGSSSGESGQYAKALQDVEDSKPTHAGISEMVTKLNKAANDANKLKQPHSAFTDVANVASRLNNERIKAAIGEKKAAMYDEALKDFGATKKIQEFLKRRASREVSGRMGPGSFMRDATQKFLDTVGYKAGARVANKMSSAVLQNPSMARNLPEMFKEFINQVEALDDETPGMAHGGIVPDMDEAVSHHLRKENDPSYRDWAAGC